MDDDKVVIQPGLIELVQGAVKEYYAGVLIDVGTAESWAAWVEGVTRQAAKAVGAARLWDVSLIDGYIRQQLAAGAARLGLLAVPASTDEMLRAGTNEYEAALIDRKGRLIFNAAMLAYKAGANAGMLTRSLRLGRGLGDLYMGHFLRILPELASCPACGVVRTKQLEFRQSLEGLLCWKCARFAEGRLTRRQADIKLAVDLYNEGPSSSEVATEMGRNWRFGLIIFDQTLFPVQGTCASCGRARGRGVKMERGIYEQDGQTTIKATCARCVQDGHVTAYGQSRVRANAGL